MSADVELERVSVQFRDFAAVSNIDLTINGGEFFSFLGPSGCGKTTLLRAISGFQEPSQGRISIDGQDMAGIGPNKRPTALVFQNLALFPLMSVAENIAFSLEVRGASQAERRKRADELLELIALPGQGDKKVQELSGGQRQRVAIARALAVEPKVLLLDEPLAALDLKLRQHMRGELRAIQKRVGITFIYITHDQGEALTMSDRVAVMSNGRIEQVADSATIYDRPRTAFVASFVGENNALAGVLKARTGRLASIETAVGTFQANLSESDGATLGPGDRVCLFVRPQSIRLIEGQSTLENSLRARIELEEFEGSFRHLVLRGPCDKRITLSVINDGTPTGHDLGDEVTIGFSAALATALPDGPLASE